MDFFLRSGNKRAYDDEGDFSGNNMILQIASKYVGSNQSVVPSLCTDYPQGAEKVLIKTKKRGLPPVRSLL
jgi:hypothetical protein